MTEKAWWRDVRGLPPSTEAARVKVLSPRRVRLLRSLLLSGLLIGILMLVTGHWAGIPLTASPVLQLFAMGSDQRQQILTRRRQAD